MFKTLKDFKKKIVFRNYFFLLIIQFTNIVLPLITFPYLVRVLGAKNYGIVMMAHSLAIFLGIIVDFGFNISATREVSLLKGDKELLSKFYSNVILIKTFLVLISFGILLFIVSFVYKFNVNKEVYLYSFGIVLGQALFPTWFFQGIEKMKIITFINLLSKIIFTALIFIFIRQENDFLLAPIFNSLGFIISGFLGLLISFKYVNVSKPNFQKIIQIIKESFSLFSSNVFVSLYTTLNTLILGLFTSELLAGVYVSMEKLIVAIKSLYSPLYQAIFPNISNKKNIEIIKYVKRLIVPVLLSGVAIMLFVIVFAENILEFVFDNELITSYYFILQILASIAVFSSLNMLYVTLLLPALKKYNKRLKLLVLAGIVNIIIVIPLIKLYSIKGVAISASFTELFLLLLSFLGFQKLKKIKN
ncbi:oligosaccharide flippase family protein [Polaribacter sp.]|uniref:oligosaccharide flippase family protein n=1 Tax=Polaribacter sp. TaxID=1920175 RepID=UPI003F6D7686